MFEDNIDLYEKLKQVGEMEVVLDSGVELVLHTHDTETYQNQEAIRTEGIPEDGGEYEYVIFDATDVEHYSYHKEI